MPNSKQIDDLESVLFSPTYSESALDYFGLHGLCSAAAISPAETSAAQMATIILGVESLDNDVPERFLTTITEITNEIRSSLSREETIIPPFLDETDDESRQHWCEGFIELYLAQEEHWSNKQSANIAELMLPIMVMSEVFEDTELQELAANKKLVSQMEEQLPELLTDLYLVLNAPDQ